MSVVIYARTVHPRHTRNAALELRGEDSGEFVRKVLNAAVSGKNRARSVISARRRLNDITVQFVMSTTKGRTPFLTITVKAAEITAIIVQYTTIPLNRLR